MANELDQTKLLLKAIAGKADAQDELNTLRDKFIAAVKEMHERIKKIKECTINGKQSEAASNVAALRARVNLEWQKLQEYHVLEGRKLLTLLTEFANWLKPELKKYDGFLAAYEYGKLDETFNALNKLMDDAEKKYIEIIVNHRLREAA